MLECAPVGVPQVGGPFTERFEGPTQCGRVGAGLVGKRVPEIIHHAAKKSIGNTVDNGASYVHEAKAVLPAIDGSLNLPDAFQTEQVADGNGLLRVGLFFGVLATKKILCAAPPSHGPKRLFYQRARLLLVLFYGVPVHRDVIPVHYFGEGQAVLGQARAARRVDPLKDLQQQYLVLPFRAHGRVPMALRFYVILRFLQRFPPALERVASLPRPRIEQVEPLLARDGLVHLDGLIPDDQQEEKQGRKDQTVASLHDGENTLQ